MTLALGLLAVLAAFLVLFFVGVRPAQAAPTTFTVDRSDDPNLTTTPTADDCTEATANDCSLRGAIIAANSNSNPTEQDTINFSIPGTGVQQIQLATSLNEISESVSINGYTQPGASVNTIIDARQGTNAQIKIEFDGSCAGCNTGFNIMADDVSIEGLAIYGFDGAGIFSNSGPDRLRLEGNFIGTDSGGTQDKGNGDGVRIQSQSSLGTTGVIVGGDAPEARNLISGNDGDAVFFQDLRNFKVQGNLIGTQKDGATPLPNAGTGVNFERNSASDLTNNHVGGTTVGAANVIAHNASEGVNVCATDNAYIQASIRRNSIFDNFEGINLCLTSPNDPGDVDSGSNGGQNRPVITSAKTSSRATIIKGTLDSEASQGYTLEFFSNPATLSGSSSYSPDEGKTFKAEKTVFTDGTGHSSFSFKLKGTQKIAAGQFVTATATNGDGDTSEFSTQRRVKRL